MKFTWCAYFVATVYWHKSLQFVKKIWHNTLILLIMILLKLVLIFQLIRLVNFSCYDKIDLVS